MLSEEQIRCLELLRTKESCFFTGKAGTGKSFLLVHAFNQSNERNGSTTLSTFITAPTGRAAKNVGGTTLHSFAGVGLGSGSCYELLNKVLSNNEAVKRWRACKTLFIDEVSMLDVTLFEKLEFIARKIRNITRPFGGIQLVLFGDFFQLPPVPNDGEENVKYCFESPLWDVLVKYSVELTTVFRQDEPEYLLLLAEVRTGEITWQTHSIINKLKRKIPDDDDTMYIYSRRDDVARKNAEIIDNIQAETKVFTSRDTGKLEWLKSCQAPKVLQLKIGARVILIQNMHAYGLVNGERGKVLGFIGKFPLVKFEEQNVVIREKIFEVRRQGNVQATRRQLPLDLGWAVTVHKAQGITVNKAVVSLNNIFAPGQAYVALSRCRTMAGLQVIPGRDMEFPVPSTKVVEFYNNKVQTIDGPTTEKNTPPDVPAQPTQTEQENTSNTPDTNPAVPPCDWDNITPLPSHVNIPEILHAIATNPLNSQITKDLCVKLNLENEISVILHKFICNIWMELDKIVVKLPPADNQEAVEIIDKKHWSGHSFLLFQLKTSDEMKNKCHEVLRNHNIISVETKLQPVHLKLLFQVIQKLHDYMIALATKNITTKHPTPPSTVILSKESQSKIRYLAGWIIFKELGATSRYIRLYYSSATKKVKKRVKKEGNIKDFLEDLTTSRSTICDHTKYPASLAHIERYNHGGLVHVRDIFFSFVVKLEEVCCQHFTQETADFYKWDAVKCSRQRIREDPILADCWRQLLNELQEEQSMTTSASHLQPHQETPELVPMDIDHIQCHSSDPETTINEEDGQDVPYQPSDNCFVPDKMLSSEIAEMTFKRLLRRYLNMRSKEYVKTLKQKLNRKKELAHRKKVEGKSGKRKSNDKFNDKLDKSVIDNIITDKTQGYISSHLILKAKAVTGSSSLSKLSKADLHCLFRLYDIKFVSKTKKVLCQMLADKIVATERIPRPDRVQTARFSRIRENHRNKKEVDDFPDVDVHDNTSNTNDSTSEEVPSLDQNEEESSASYNGIEQSVQTNVQNTSNPNKRRPKFTPSPSQLMLLLEDHEIQPNKELNMMRSREFAVHISQIESWHKRQKKRDKQTTTGIKIMNVKLM